jgi:hypothetical protein
VVDFQVPQCSLPTSVLKHWYLFHLFVFAVLESVKKSVKECAVCEASMGAFDELLGDPNIQKDVELLLKKVCPKLPAQDQAEVRSCDRMKCLFIKRPYSGIPRHLYIVSCGFLFNTYTY